MKSTVMEKFGWVPCPECGRYFIGAGLRTNTPYCPYCGKQIHVIGPGEIEKGGSDARREVKDAKAELE